MSGAFRNAHSTRAAKVGFKPAREMSWDQAEDYLYAKLEQSQFLDHENTRSTGLSEFLDAKTYRPGLGTVPRKDPKPR